MIHDARIVRLNGEHPASRLRHWMGDSVGLWEGDTLIVDSTSFTHKIASFAPSPFVALGTGEHLHLIERLRLLDADTLEYEFTVEDPSTFARPFTAVLLMKRTGRRVYEYACHEGNKPLRHILWAARKLESEEGQP